LGARRRGDVANPAGQFCERGFADLSPGPTPRTPLEEWTFSIQGRRGPGALVDVRRIHGPAGGRTSTSTVELTSERFEAARSRAISSDEAIAGDQFEVRGPITGRSHGRAGGPLGRS
jgi:hypothetical protein